MRKRYIRKQTVEREKYWQNIRLGASEEHFRGVILVGCRKKGQIQVYTVHVPIRKAHKQSQDLKEMDTRYDSCGVTFIVVANGHGDPSSNLWRDCLLFTWRSKIGNVMNAIILTLTQQ